MPNARRAPHRLRLLAAALCLFSLAYAPTAFAQVYTVRSGDTLYLLAQQFGTSVAGIQNANKYWSTNLYPGLRLWIPENAAVKQYTVRSGDTLYLIAQRFGTSVGALKNVNRLYSTALAVGQLLRIPSSAPAAVAPSGSATQMSASQLDWLARAVEAEAGGEPYLGKVAVAATILNRVADPRYPNTVTGVLFQRYQFESVSNGYIYNHPATATDYKAAEDALAGWDPTYGAIGFYNPYKLSGANWVTRQTVTTQIGNHVFFRA